MVDRENIYVDTIKHIKWRNVSTSKIEIHFKGEEVVGDGVTKDAFFFWTLSLKKDTFYKVPFSISDEEELKIAGKIIQKEFVQYQVFSITTSLKASSIFCQSMLGNMMLHAYLFRASVILILN